MREFSFISPLFTEKLELQSDPSKRYSQELSNSLVSLNVLASLCCLVRHSMLSDLYDQEIDLGLDKQFAYLVSLERR